jgi:putative spermidine/putrescine transport system ATP-binding protein
MAGIAGLVLLFLVLPVLALVPMSVSAARWLELPPRELSLRWYVTFFTDRDWIEATLVSLRVAAGASALAVVLGTLAGVGLARGRFPGRAVVRTLALSPLVVPLMVLAIALYYVFGRAGLVGTVGGLVLAHALLGVPYVVLNVEAGLRVFDVRLERAARSLGASAWQAFWRVTLPLIRAGVLAGALFAFVASLDEVVVAMFLSGTSAITLPKLMWDSITQDELNPVVAAVASLQIAVAALAVGASEWLRRRAGARLAAAPAGVPEGDAPARSPSLAAAPPRLEAAPLRLVGVTRRFGPVLAVDDVTLEVQPGELVTLLGPSGSGKTTLLNLVAGFEPPTGGEIYLGERRITGEPPNRRDIGMVFQDLALFPHLTVFENVAFPLRLRKVAEPEIRGRVGEALALVRLEGLDARAPRQLSGGQQQRVALARALVFRPPLLLMDEPFGALDRTLRERLQGELRQLQRRLGITVLFVTHDQAEAMALSDRIVVIDRGRLQQVGRPEELYEAPANPFVADFIGESNLLRCAAVDPAGDLLRVRTAGGSEFVVGAVATAEAARHLVLRPESLRLHTDGQPGGPAVEGVVEEAIYLGGVVKYLVRINAAEVLTVRAPKPPGARALAPGTAVQVAWEPPDVLLL